ncbi:hypothetical protein KP509_36G010900 [Ceratopteris richardii]|nr:hypothetical protein KP509_36G010900 [Ceratopteris richardii]
MTVGFQTPPIVSSQDIVAGQPSGVYAAVPQSITGYQSAQHQQLRQFWAAQMQEVQHVTDFKVHQLPLARIKKIMKADEDVRMIAAEAPVLFAKACEMFILELTLRSWIHTEENRRRTLQKNDIAAAIPQNEIFDFLVDIVPRDEVKEEGLGMPRANLPVGAPVDPLPYGGIYFMASAQPPGMVPMMTQPPPHIMTSPGIIIGRPAMPVDSITYNPGVPYAHSSNQTWQQLQPQDVQPDGPEASS